MAYAQLNGMRSTRYPLSGCGCGTSGLGDLSSYAPHVMFAAGVIGLGIAALTLLSPTQVRRNRRRRR
jgi:hypothetical protein